jgi:cytochrome c biogenesis factor
MCKKTWNYKEGLLIGLGLLIAGEALQFSIGSIRWSLLAAPVNLMAGAVYLLALLGMSFTRERVYLFRWLSTPVSAAASLLWTTGITVVMGCIRQQPAGVEASHELLGFSQMTTNWAFVLLYFWMMTSLGLTILRTAIPFHGRQLPVLLCHIGLFIALGAATLGSADMRRLQMIVSVGQTKCRAFNEENIQEELPISIELKQFTLDEYPAKQITTDSTSAQVMPYREPKRFASDVKVYTEAGEVKEGTIEVNHPMRIDGWEIYQAGYDAEKGSWSRISVFELVRDPALPIVYIGIVLLALGAIGMFIKLFIKLWRRYKWIRSLSLMLAAVFICMNLFDAELNSKTLVPALQSPWFRPHVTVYMFSYTLLGATALIAVYLLCFKKRDIAAAHMYVCDCLVCIGTMLLTLGLLSGAIWAKEAWGHYWSWDPKETWAAATWCAYLMYIHYRLSRPRARKRALVITIVAFLLLQMCWYGIYYLPSAQASVHVYT